MICARVWGLGGSSCPQGLLLCRMKVKTWTRNKVKANMPPCLPLSSRWDLNIIYQISCAWSSVRRLQFWQDEVKEVSSCFFLQKLFSKIFVAQTGNWNWNAVLLLDALQGTQEKPDRDLLVFTYEKYRAILWERNQNRGSKFTLLYCPWNQELCHWLLWAWTAKSELYMCIYIWFRIALFKHPGLSSFSAGAKFVLWSWECSWVSPAENLRAEGNLWLNNPEPPE